MTRLAERLTGLEPWWLGSLAAVFGRFAAQRAYEHSWGWLAFDVFFVLFYVCEAAQKHLENRDRRRRQQWWDFFDDCLSAD